MERNRSLDAPGSASIRKTLVRVFVLLVFAASAALGVAQSNQLRSESTQLYDAHQWDELIQKLAPLPDRSADLDLYYGVALANRERLSEARDVLLLGHKLQPSDSRFQVELGGIAFKEKKYAEATDWLMEANHLNPDDAYINDFLGTLYYLQGNPEAALKYWNRVGRPYIENIRIEPALRIDPVVLDRAFAFSQGSVLNLRDLITTEARLRSLGVVPTARIELAAREDGKFDIVLRADEKSGFGKNWWMALLMTFRGAPYLTATPEYFNIGKTATNVTTLERFHPERRRFAAVLSGPLHRDSKWRYRIAGDFRNENWNVRNFSAPGDVGSLNFRRTAVSADITSIRSGKWGWNTGFELSYRDYRGIQPGSQFTPDLLLQGYQLKHIAQFTYELLRVPEHHYLATSSLSTQTGRIWSADPQLYLKFQASIAQRWFASRTGDDFQMFHRVTYGRTVGDLPFDELFMLGVDRDGDYNMRGHSVTDRGRKGYAPLGRNYFVSDWEFDKNVYGNGLVKVKVGPFIDTGKITDPFPYLGSKKWLLDTGPQVKLRTLGVQIVLTYGRDLRTGSDAWSVYMGR